MIAYDVDLKSDSTTILYDPKKVTIEELKQAVDQAGFQGKSIEELPK